MIPDVSGLTVEEATEELKNSGFNVTTRSIIKKEFADGAVIGAEYAEDNDDDLVLLINDLAGSNPSTAEDSFLYDKIWIA